MDEQVRKITPSQVRSQNLNPYVESDVELQSHLITPQNGRAKIGKDLDRLYKIRYNDGNVNQEDNAWDLFTAITSDTRLSNLTPVQEKYVQWAIKVQGYCIMWGLSKSGSQVDWMRASICEPGLGRQGFLRNNIQTIHTKSESVNIEAKPEKRGLFGGLMGGK